MSELTPDQRKRRLQLAFAIAVLIGAIILIFATEFGSISDKAKENPPATPAQPATPASGAPKPTSLAPAREPVIEPGPTAVRAFAANLVAPPAPDANSYAEVAALLNSPDHTAHDDVVAVSEIVANYIQQFHEAPVGNNAEITGALAGDNARGHAGLRADHPAINAQGELTDRWGTPYFFHQLASDLMEIRSAGPDRRLFTEDDVLWPQAETTALAQTAP